MISKTLQSQIREQVVSTHDSAELRTIISKIKTHLYQKNALEFETVLHTLIPLKFSFLHDFLATSKEVVEQEQKLDLLEKYLLSIEVMYLTLSYSPTHSQLLEFMTILRKSYTQPFVLKVTTDETTVGEITWELQGERHHHSIFSNTQGTAHS